MIFTKEDYTYIPPELEDEFFDSSSELEDAFADEAEMSHAEDSPKPRWTWPNGNNSSEYNAWYWDTHKDEIMKRREELKKERGLADDKYGINESREDLTKAALENLNAHSVSLNDRKNLMTAIERELLSEGGADERRSSNKNAVKNTKPDPKSAELQKLIDQMKADAESAADEKSSKKKKSSSSGGSSGSSSSKKSSSGSSKSKKKSGIGGSGGSGSKASKGAKSSGSSSSSKKSDDEDKDNKKKTEKEESKKTTTDTSEKSTDKKVKETTKTEPRSFSNDEMNTIQDKFKDIFADSVNDASEEKPENNYEAFIKKYLDGNDSKLSVSEGLQLWAMYRTTQGLKTTEEQVNKEKEKDENKKLQHGLDTFENALEHHGILGMKWGVQNGPPYPLSYGAHNASEKKAGWHKSLSAASQKAVAKLQKAYDSAEPVAKKAAKDVKDTVAKARERRRVWKQAKEEAARAEYQRNRETAIKSGDAKYAREHFQELSNDEVNELLGRYDLSKKVDSANNVKTASDKIDSMMNSITRAKDWTEKGSNAWNAFAKIYNTMNGEDPLPVIGQDFNETKRKIADQAAKKEREKTINEIIRNNEAIKKNLYNMTPSELDQAKKAVNNRISILNSLNGNNTANSDVNALKDELDSLNERINKLEENK